MDINREHAARLNQPDVLKLEAKWESRHIHRVAMMEIYEYIPATSCAIINMSILLTMYTDNANMGLLCMCVMSVQQFSNTNWIESGGKVM